jgi:hypothetical protein
MTVERSQQWYLGLSLNAQGLFDYLLPRQSTWRKVTHGLFEVTNLPYTAFPVVDTTYHTTKVNEGGA